MGPKVLWWAATPHSGEMSVTGAFNNTSQLIKTIYFNAVLHNTSSLCPKLIFLVLFSLFAGTEEAKGGSHNEDDCSTPWVRGTPGAGDGLGGYPVSQLVDLMAVRVHGANELAPPSSWAPSPSVERWHAPSPLAKTPKRAHHSPIGGPEWELAHIAGGASTLKPPWGHR